MGLEHRTAVCARDWKEMRVEQKVQQDQKSPRLLEELWGRDCRSLSRSLGLGGCCVLVRILNSDSDLHIDIHASS